MDNACLNVDIYYAHKTNNYYTLGQKSLAKLILCQLSKNSNNRYKLLRKQGTYSTLFRLTLESYEYTFIIKGTIIVFKAKLKYKGLIY